MRMWTNSQLLVVLVLGLVCISKTTCTQSQSQSERVWKMKAVGFTPGSPENLFIEDVSLPEPKDKEIRIKVFATAINRADTLQRKGSYSPPPGVSEILGLEAVGEVDVVGPGCPQHLQPGQRVMALLAGGGNAEYVTCRYEQVMPLPRGLSFTEAAAIPEVWLTAFQLLYTIGNLKASDTVLIHAGGSGVGTAATQLVKQAGATAIVTAGSEEKINFAKSLGAKAGINYKSDNVAEKVLQTTNGQGVDLILDCVGASMFDANVASINVDGRWVSYGFLGGSQSNVNFGLLLRKRVNLHFTTLRFRPVEYKEELIKNFTALALPLFENKTFQPIIHTILPLTEIAKAHSLMEENQNLGKIVLKVREDDGIKKEEL